jgi:hypothetical protein
MRGKTRTPRGSEIRNQVDRLRLLQCFAWAGQNIETGVAFSVEDHQVEYWYNLTPQPDPEADNGDLPRYVRLLQEAWFEQLSNSSSQIADQVVRMNVREYRLEMRYVGNGLRVWFVPAHPSFNDWKPLLDSPLVRDKWVFEDVFALSYPANADDQCLNPSTIFDGDIQERYDDPEVQGGRTVLIAAESKTVQKPPNHLDQMKTRKQKQVAYNERIIIIIIHLIIIHLLGLAPAGYLTTPDNGPEGRLSGGASQGDGCRAVPLNAAELGGTRKPFGL